MRVSNLSDFRGGYFTNTPSSLLKPNELLKAQNLQWRNGLKKRQGLSEYSATFTASTIKGAFRAYLASTWYDIVAVDNSSNVHFYRTATTAWTQITGATFTTGKDNVDFAQMGTTVVAVNGFDEALVIDSSFSVQTLDVYDERTLTTVDWWAGQYDDSAAAASKWVDDSTDAADAGADDFEVANTTTNNGFWISADTTFNKVTLNSVQAATGSPVVEYRYWNGTTWTAPTIEATIDWTAAEANKTLEFTMPQDWALLPSSEGGTGSEATNRYVLRVRFTTAPSNAPSADSIAVYHSDKSSEVFGFEKPLHVWTHNSRMWLSFKNSINVNYSPPNKTTGWRAGEAEYFREGGPEVRAGVSFQGGLLVFKDDGLYTYFGNSLADFQRRWVSDRGTIAPRSVAVVGNYVFRVCSDGVWMWDGREDYLVSKHIDDDFQALTKTDACGVEYQGEYWVSFPTSGVTLTCDPDTLRRDDVGDYLVSWYRFNNYGLSQFVYHSDSSDNGLLLAIKNATNPYLARCDNGTQDDGSNVTSIMHTPYLMDSGDIKKFHRLKIVMDEVATTNGSSHTLELYSNDGDRTATTTFSVDKGSGVWENDLTLPYTLDGRNIQIRITHSGPTTTRLKSIHLSHDKRRF